MITSAIFTVLLAILVGLLFYSSYLWDRVIELEDRLKELGDGQTTCL